MHTPNVLSMKTIGTLSLFALLTIGLSCSVAQGQTISSLGWNSYSNWSGTLGNGSSGSGSGAPTVGHYDPSMGAVTITGPSVTTSLTAVNGPLSIPTTQNFVQPGDFTGIYSPGTADALSWGDNHGSSTGSGLWHTSTLAFSSALTMTGTQFVGFTSSAIDFGGLLIVNSGDTHTVNLSLAGGATFSGINFSDLSDTYSVTGLGTSSVVLSWTGSNVGQAIYNPVISGNFTSLSISQLDMANNMTTNEPNVYYRANTASIAAVPEPSSVFLLGVGGILGLARSRSRNVAKPIKQTAH